MSGHSKWSTIKHKKGLKDQKRGKIFSRLVKQIQITARDNPDPETNANLRTTIDKAKAENMPNSNIERAIKKASGDGDGARLEEITLEAYGSGGSAFLIEAITDNHNRTVAEVKHLIENNSGHMAEKGSVSWLFEQKVIITIDASDWDEEIELLLIDAGLEDSQSSDDTVMLLINPQFEQQAKKAIESKDIKIISEEFDQQPKNSLELNNADREKVEKLNELIDDYDDTKAVYNNLA